MNMHPAKLTARMIIGERIRKGRIAKGWSLDQFAKTLDISKVSVWQWEQGKSGPRVSRVAEVAELLGLPIDALIDQHAPERAPDREASQMLLDYQKRIAKSFGVDPSNIEIKVSFGGKAS